MTSFSELIRRWNKGIARGAQVRFARKVGVNRVTLSRWMNGRDTPGEDSRPRIAKELGISVDELMDSLGGNPRVLREQIASYKIGAVSMALSPDEEELLGEISRKDTRSPVDEIRWLIKAYHDGKLIERAQAPESGSHQDILTADLRRQLEKEAMDKARAARKTGS